MKRVSVFLISMVAIVALQPATASDSGAIAIIDVNFDEKLIEGPITEVCISAPSMCASTALPRKVSEFQIYNHGTIMADIARANNPTAHLILIEAGSSKTGVITGINLQKALNWVEANAQAYGIRSVSFSYNSGNGDKCRPSSPGVKVDDTHNNIVAAAANLKSMGVRFYAAAGNHGSGNKVDYPACIEDVISVGSTIYRGSMAKSDIVISGFTYTSPRLKSALKSLQDRGPVTLTDVNPIRVGNTTSVTTAIAASIYR